MPIIDGLASTRGGQGPGYRRFVEFNAPIEAVVWWLLAMAMTNVLECEASPRLKAELLRRGDAALAGAKKGDAGILPGTKIAPLEYRLEPVDIWRSFAAMAEFFPGQTIIGDCDCFSPLWAAYFRFRGCPRVGLEISQPKLRPCCTGPECGPYKLCGHGMAHAYTVVDNGSGKLRPFDGSSHAGMKPQPAPSFYGSGESATLLLPR